VKKYFGLIIIILLSNNLVHGAYLIKGKISPDTDKKYVYFEILENWNDFTSVSENMILKEVVINPDGSFLFEGSELSNKVGLYRIRYAKSKKHRISISNGHYVSFIFSNKDTIEINKLQIVNGKYQNNRFSKVQMEIDSIQSFQRIEKKDSKLQELIKFKLENYLESEAIQLNHPLCQLFLFTQTNPVLIDDKTITEKILFGLRDTKIRSTYYHSFKKETAINFNTKLVQRVNFYRLLFLISILLNLILFVLLYNYLWNKRKINLTRAEQLTNKEKQVLEKLKLGFSNKEISTELYISESTVKSHLNKIYKKLGVSNRKEAIKSLSNQ